LFTFLLFTNSAIYAVVLFVRKSKHAVVSCTAYILTLPRNERQYNN